MTDQPVLPFERRFFEWAARHDIQHARVSFSCPPSGASTSGHRFTPPAPRRVLLALHGAGNDSLFGWIGLFKRQLLLGTEIFTYDLPGHGRGGSSDFSPVAATESVRAALREGVPASPGRPVHAIGVSLGGSVLLAALPALQDQLATAALVVAPLTIELSLRSFLAELRPENIALLWRERAHYGADGLIPSFGPFKREIYPLRLAEAAPPGAFGYVAALNRDLSAMDLLAAAERTRVPVLLAYGTRDRVVPAEQGERLAAAMPRAELMRVDGGTHLSTPMSRRLLERLDTWFTGTAS